MTWLIYIIIYLGMYLNDIIMDEMESVQEDLYEKEYDRKPNDPIDELGRDKSFTVPMARSRGNPNDPRLTGPISVQSSNLMGEGTSVNINKEILKGVAITKPKKKRDKKVFGLSTISESNDDQVKVSKETKERLGGHVTLLDRMRENPLEEEILEKEIFGGSVISLMRDKDRIKNPMDRIEAIDNLFDGKGYKI